VFSVLLSVGPRIGLLLLLLLQQQAWKREKIVIAASFVTAVSFEGHLLAVHYTVAYLLGPQEQTKVHWILNQSAFLNS
jgi:hypothetical protein